MRTQSVHRYTVGHIARFGLFALFATSLAPAARADHAPLTRGQERVEASNNALRRKWQKIKVAQITPMGGKSAQVLQVQSDDNQLFIVRRPRRQVEHGLRVNIAQQRLAAAMGDDRLVPAAIIDTTQESLDANSPAGAQVLVVKHVGPMYYNANKFRPQQLVAVPERSRLVSAIIDLLAEQQDRKSENIMVKRDGSAIRMIDPDKSFGERHGRKYRSQFFHGGVVGYTSQQNRFEDLPADLQTFIDALSKATVPDIMKIYGLTEPEATVVSNQAARIRTVGLKAAIDEYVTSLGELHAPE